MSSIFRCDKKTRKGICGRKPYMEVYWKGSCNDPECPCNRHWSYLCRYHYYIDRIKNALYIFLTGDKEGGNWYCDADDVEEDEWE